MISNGSTGIAPMDEKTLGLFSYLCIMPKYKGFDITRSSRKGKKYKACKDGKCIHFGASGYTIKPNTPRGDSYCARSAGIKSAPNSANSFARALWSCKGSKSVNSKPFFGKIKLP